MKKEKPPMGGKATRERDRRDGPGENDQPRRQETEARARELAERHRETLDYLSKN